MPDGMTASPSYSDLFRVFGRIGLMSFGGPVAQISLMHRALVEEQAWLEEKQFLGALSFCMLLPGPEAMQLATFTGWKLRGTLGGMIAGLLFVLPGAILITLLAGLYVAFGQIPIVQSAFLGVKAAVVAVVLQAMFRLAPKVLTSPLNISFAVAACCILYMGVLPFPALILGAGVAGYVTARPPAVSTAVASTPMPAHGLARRTLKTAVFWGILWAAPIVLVWGLGHAFLTEIAVFFSKLAVVTFGGAYAVLAYMVQAVVTDFEWLTTAQMMDALGLAETTPGPLILVTQFVGHLAGYAQGGVGLAIIAGLLTLWCTFVPCFLWIFAGAPYVDTLLENPRLSGALKVISASVLGVIANLSIWFALHVIFQHVVSTRFGAVPDLASFDPTAFGMVCIGVILLILCKIPLVKTLALTAGISMIAGLL